MHLVVHHWHRTHSPPRPVSLPPASSSCFAYCSDLGHESSRVAAAVAGIQAIYLRSNFETPTAIALRATKTTSHRRRHPCTSSALRDCKLKLIQLPPSHRGANYSGKTALARLFPRVLPTALSSTNTTSFRPPSLSLRIQPSKLRTGTCYVATDWPRFVSFLKRVKETGRIPCELCSFECAEGGSGGGGGREVEESI